MAKKQSNATRQANAERAAERAAAIRREQEQKERRRRTIVVSVVVVGVLSVIVAIAAAIQSTRDSAGGGEGQVAGPPAGVVERYAVPLGQADAPVSVEVYEDFMCPACGQFEAQSAPALNMAAEAGDARILFRPISFLDETSNGTRYSTRAANAFAVVLDEAGAQAAIEFHNLLFANQPAEGTDGLSDDQLVDLAVEAGAERDAVTGPIDNLKFEQWVGDATAASQNEGVGGTPTVVVGGEVVEDWSPQALLAAIAQAKEAAK